MKNCKYCQTPLLKNARFCHQCGKQAITETQICVQCNSPNPNQARFCFECGFALSSGQGDLQQNITPIYRLNFNDMATLPLQLRELFLVAISLTVQEDGELERESLYLEAFQSSGFRSAVFEERSIDLTQQFEQAFLEEGAASFLVTEQSIYTVFQELIELFFIQYAKTLLPYELPRQILDFKGITLATVHLPGMIRAYLDLENEGERYYVNAVDIPLKKMRNARAAFFKPQAGEVPYLFIDQTLFGSGKEGLILTNKSIYWKAAFHKAAKMEYGALKKIKRFPNHLELEGIYLNLTPSINYKLLKLLQRLKHLFGGF